MKKRSLSYRAKKLMLKVTMIVGTISLFFTGGKKDEGNNNKEGSTEISISIEQNTNKESENTKKTETTTEKKKEENNKTEKESNKTTISLRKIKNNKKSIKYYDKAGIEKGELKGVKKVLALNYNKDKKMYRSAIILPNGKIEYHYLKESDLSKKSLSELKVKNINNLNKIMQISAKSGAWSRKNRLVDKDTNDAELLDPSTYVLGYSTTSNVKENTYDWRKIVYIDKKGNLKERYIADDYLMDTNIKKFDGKTFIVNTNKEVSLKLRDNHNINANIIERINSGEKVYLVKNIKATYEEKDYTNGVRYTWFYVAYYDKKEDILKFGWCANEGIKDDGYVTGYLKEVKENQATLTKEKKEHDKTLVKVVNTNDVNGVNLKLRKKPGTTSEIISEIENGSTVYIKKSDMNNKTEKDNYKWVYIETQSGKKGYVASEYLKDKKKNKNKFNSHKINISSDYEGTIDGYIGIDINTKEIDENDLRRIFEKKLKVPGTTKRDVIASNKYTPSFVIIKAGAYGYGINKHNYIDIRNKVDKIVNICEEYHIPYGLYFYSTSLTKEEADEENKDIVDYVKKIEDNDYFALGFYLNREAESREKGSRVLAYTDKGQNIEQIKKQTEVVNYQMTELQKKLPNTEIKMYTEPRSLGLIKSKQGSIIKSDKNLDYDLLKHKDNLWIVDYADYKTCTEAIKNRMDMDKITARQLLTDVKMTKNNGEKTNIIVDVDLMNKDYFEKCLKKKNIKIAEEENDTKYCYKYDPNSRNADLMADLSNDLSYSTTNYNIKINTNPKTKIRKI